MKSRAEAVSPKSPTVQSAAGPSFESLPQLLAFAALLLVLFVAPAQFSGFWPASYDYLPQSLFSGLTSIAALLLALSPRPAPRRTPIGWCLAALLGWMVLASPVTVYVHDTLLELARVGTCLAWFWIAREFLKDQFAERAGLALGAVTLGALWVVLPPILGFARERSPQLSAYFANVNMYANYCAVVFPCALSFAFALRRMVPEKARAAALLGGLAAAVVIAVGLVVSASKGGLLALFAAGLVWAAIAIRARAGVIREFVRARRALVIGGALVVLLLGGGVAMKTVVPRLLTARGAQNNSTMFRLYTWRATEKMIAARPVFGWGPASFPSVMNGFSETGYTRHAHHSWLQLAAESGVPAMLLLGATCIVALESGWRAARTARWNEAAAGAGALTAFAVHGFFDTGWGVSSIVLVLAFGFALLDGAAAAGEATLEPPVDGGNLRFPWLGAVLVLGAAAWLTQRAAAGEDLRNAAGEAAKRGDGSGALRLSGEATLSDPLSARLQSNDAQLRESSGQAADPIWETATRLRRTDPNLWRLWGEYRAARGSDAKVQFDTAVSLAPLDSHVLYARGDWLLSKGNASGWKDFEKIELLLDQPYGLYPATPDLFVDMDAVRALLRLARHDIAAKNGVRAKTRLDRAAKMIAQEQSIIDQQRAMDKSMEGTGIDLGVPKDLDTLVADLHELQAKL